MARNDLEVASDDDLETSSPSLRLAAKIARALATLTACNKLVMRAESEPALLVAFCEAIVETGGYRMAWVGQAVHDAAKSVRILSCVGANAGAYLAGIEFSWREERRGWGPTADAILTRAPVTCNDLQAQQDYGQWSGRALEHGYRASIALPICIEDEVFTLCIYAGEPNTFGQEERGLLLGVAENLAFGLAHLRQRERQARTDWALREAQRIARLGSWEWDLATWKLDWSRQIYHLLGLPPDTLPDPEIYYTVVHPEDVGGLQRAVQLALKGLTAYSIDYRIVRSNGELRWLHGQAEMLLDAAGVPVRMVGTIQDITERRATEEELARRTAQLEQARVFDRLKDDFLHTVAHALRSPLTVIVGYAEMLEEPGDEPSGVPRQELVAPILQASFRLVKLVDELLERHLKGRIFTESQETASSKMPPGHGEC